MTSQDHPLNQNRLSLHQDSASQRGGKRLVAKGCRTPFYGTVGFDRLPRHFIAELVKLRRFDAPQYIARRVRRFGADAGHARSEGLGRSIQQKLRAVCRGILRAGEGGHQWRVGVGGKRSRTVGRRSGRGFRGGHSVRLDQSRHPASIQAGYRYQYRGADGAVRVSRFKL